MPTKQKERERENAKGRVAVHKPGSSRAAQADNKQDGPFWVQLVPPASQHCAELDSILHKDSMLCCCPCVAGQREKPIQEKVRQPHKENGASWITLPAGSKQVHGDIDQAQHGRTPQPQ
jgi:hypothetical protein